MDHEREDPHRRHARGADYYHPGEDEPMGRASELKPLGSIIERLELALDWYQGMMSPDTGRLVHGYDPVTNRFVGSGSAIRDIAAVWNLEVLSDFLGHHQEVAPVLARSLEHYAHWLTPREGSLHFDSGQLGEPAGIPHNAFMVLALVDSESVRIPRHDETVTELAQGILSQQRGDGSYRIYFDSRQDEGLELYPGEAMLALMRAYEYYPDARYLNSVEHGFAHYRERFPPQAVRQPVQVFYANWQSQYAALLHRHTRSDAIREQVRDYIFELHDHIVSGGFYEEMEHQPGSRITVEVACSLEGLNDAYSIAVREQDPIRSNGYKSCIRVALTWLLEAQRLEDCTVLERGGFGESLTDRNQRIDVTGHAVSGFIKTVENGINFQ